MKRIFPPSFYNLRTLIGAAIASVSFGLVLFLTILDLFAGEQKPYVGILTFIILPIFILFGLALGFWGVWREHKLEKQGLPHEMKLPSIDLNDPRQRNAFFWISLSGILLLLFSAFGSFKAYEYTDSDEFCGTMCHKVMEPEYTAYQNSPHAHVGCAKCHIGPGAGWFVRSKLSGAYQVYSTIFNKYSRPIETPIQNLRPAQETCEQCHWPKHFFSEMHVTKSYFLSDETNTRRDLDLLLKVGGGNEEAGLSGGIHWNMNIANEITYAPADRQRQVIPWVKVKSKKDGSEHIYKNIEDPIKEDSLANLEKRTMDCIDCHNRPSHIYHPPAPTVDHVLSAALINPKLPYAKSVAVKALEQSFSSPGAAHDSIKITIEDYYRINYPQIASGQTASINQMITAVQKLYARNYFPTMGVAWRHFPNNIGHLFYNGCFRCHDNKHVREDGKVLTNDCSVCHTILAQSFGNDKKTVSLEGVQYRHPVDIGNSWKEMNCSDCHAAQE